MNVSYSTGNRRTCGRLKRIAGQSLNCSNSALSFFSRDRSIGSIISGNYPIVTDGDDFATNGTKARNGRTDTGDFPEIRRASNSKSSNGYSKRITVTVIPKMPNDLTAGRN